MATFLPIELRTIEKMEPVTATDVKSFLNRLPSTLRERLDNQALRPKLARFIKQILFVKTLKRTSFVRKNSLLNIPYVFECDLACDVCQQFCWIAKCQSWIRLLE